jgi:uncharacterized protein YggU (UPF0235/DUF167 family)
MRILRIKVKPGARKDALEQLADGGWQAQRPGAAGRWQGNAAVIALVAATSVCARRKCRYAAARRAA